MLRPALCLAAAMTVCACGSSTSGTAPSGGSSSGSGKPPLVAVAESRAGTHYRQEITSPVTGDSVVFEVFEPTQLEVGKTYPLVLQSHGYGGTRMTEASGFAQRLLDEGYYVISIDERGFGESGGTVRVMDPDYEGQNLIAVLDWAENLEGLRRRDNNEMVVGSYGGSYGGMYQMLLYMADPKHRLRVLAPDITPHDLTYSLDSHNVIKSGYAVALSAGGESPTVVLDALTGLDPTPLQGYLQRPGPRQDALVLETLIQGALTNQFPDAGFNAFKYHSVAYFCDGQQPGPQNFLVATPDTFLVAPVPPPAADVLVTQGFRDTLFNFNDGLGNYECLKALGGDVRLLTHQTGHILPVSLTSIPGAEDALDPFFAAVTVPNFQDAGGSRSCGSLDLDEVTHAWFQEKLQNQAGAVDAVLKSGSRVCLSLGEGDAVAVNQVKRGGTAFEIDASTPQLSGALSIIGSVLGNAFREQLLANQTLMTVPAGGAVIAGVPTLAIDMQGLSGAEMATCATAPLSLGCDPILYFAIGHRKAGTERWDVIDDQITPVRGFGVHTLEMNGIAERLAEGDELALLIYGFHAQYPVTWSRDLLVPALNLTGTVALPLLAPGEIAQNGV
ncbi:CocE/NonD family hydrolase [Sinimarinibacterium sp. CAU 1509]|uniref:CocE/NonD family hydrolase n=1 Tax=Sinimarinibacterium sp. CAU 1509 TaxID=2562283 RepID=UPI00200AF2B6|nr:CocE/NonD family hydrolase [Sinimarinibacterium sp. CAU 1509]